MKDVIVDIVLLLFTRITLAMIISSFIVCINCFRNKLLRNISGAVSIVLLALMILFVGYRMEWDLSETAANLIGGFTSTVVPYSPLIVFMVSSVCYYEAPKGSDERQKLRPVVKCSGIIAGIVIALTVVVLCIFLPGIEGGVY